MAESACGQDEVNSAFWLATQVGKMSPGILPARDFPRWSRKKSYFNGDIINPLLTKTTRYSPHSFFAFLLSSISSRSINTPKRIWPMYPAIFTSRLVCTNIIDHTDLECPLSASEKKREIAMIANTWKKCCKWKNLLYKQCLLLATNISHCLLSAFIGLVSRYYLFLRLCSKSGKGWMTSQLTKESKIDQAENAYRN